VNDWSTPKRDPRDYEFPRLGDDKPRPERRTYEFRPPSGRPARPPDIKRAARLGRKLLLPLQLALPLLFVLYALGILYWHDGTLVVDIPGGYPCSDAGNSACLVPDPAVADAYINPNVCSPGGKVCLVPLGGVPLGQIEEIRNRLQANTGIEVVILPPLPVPASALDKKRKQYAAEHLEAIISSHYQRTVAPEDTLLVGITPVDIFLQSETWRWAFGQMSQYRDGRKIAIVATNRMAGERLSRLGPLPIAFAHGSAPELTAERAYKMVNKYAAMSLLGFEPSGDPSSPVYNHIRSARDLDRMQDAYLSD
jgi:predicted Zn-dependent protease